jgi:HEAT repeat protein
MNPRHARYVLVLLGALVVLLIGRAWMRARHNYDLLMDMQSKDPAVRIAAVKGLMPPDHLVDIVLAQPMKITETKTPSGTRLDVIATDTTVRTAAVDAVAEAAKLPDMQKQCIKALIGLLKGVDREASDPSQKVKDAEAAVRTKTWQYLGAIGEPALPDLLEALRDPSNTVRDGAVEALGIIGEPAVPGLMVAFRDRDRRGKAWAALDKIKKPALQPLIPLLKMRIPKDEGFPVDVASLLGSIDDPAAVPALLEQINDVKVPGLRRQVVRSLTAIADPRATLPILKLSYEDPQMTLECITAFGEFRDPRAVPRLIELLSHYDADVPPAAVAALQKIGKPSIPALLVAAKDKNAQRRANAVLALGSIGGPETVPVLLAAAKDADPSVRLSAVIGLGKLTGPDAVRATPVLVAHFTDEGEIASAAADSLQSIVANMPAEQASLIPSVLRPLVEAMGTQGEDLTPVYYASRVLARIGSRAAPVLAQELKSPSAWRRKWAALTLGDMEDKDAVRKEVPALQSLLADGNADVRWAASKALQKMGIVPNRQLASGY